MGTALSVLREQEAKQEAQAKEQLAMLEKMAQAQLASKVDEILHGRSDDEEIHKGLVVAKHQQIFVNASSKSDKAHKAIDDFFSGDLLNGAKELILGGVDELLGNYSVGENESEDMLILWENNALLRVDVYYWKWNFSSEGVVKVAQNVFAVYCVKRVINPEQVDPNVLIYAISRMCAKNKMKADEALDYVKKIMEKLKEVKEAINWKPPQITEKETVRLTAAKHRLQHKATEVTEQNKTPQRELTKTRKTLPGVQKPLEKCGPTTLESTGGGAIGGGSDEDDDDFDLFGSDDEEEKAAQWLQKKKTKKPSVWVAKSNIILDVKPWDDEIDMAEVEKMVRSIEHDGLLWGASKLVPLAYGIKKLQISCVVEDDKVGTDFLEEAILAYEDLIQSVDVAAFNKV